jgi:hypothetical protein
VVDSLRPDIQAAKDKMQYRLGAGREIKRLTNYLWDGEVVHLMAAGQYGPGQGVVVLTDRRLLFLKDGMTRQATEDFPIDKIASVQWNAGMVLGSLTIFASGNKAEIERMDKKDGRQIADAVRSRLSTRTAQRPVMPQAMVQPPMPPPMMRSTHPVPLPPAEPDVYEQLRKLGELRDLGIVTTEEFEQKKRELLARI